MMDKLWDRWKVDIPTLDKEDWDECLGQGPRLVIASGDKLIQVKFLHRFYFTPARLHKMYPDRDPQCHRCRTQLGTYFHIFWEWESILEYKLTR